MRYGLLNTAGFDPKSPYNDISTSVLYLCYTYFNLILFLCTVLAVDLKQTVHVDEDLQIRAYYAGHVRLVSFIFDVIFHAVINLTPDMMLIFSPLKFLFNFCEYKMIEHKMPKNWQIKTIHNIIRIR